MKLSVQNREISGKKVKNLRKEGLVPGVIYGRAIDAPISIQFEKQPFLRLYKKVWETTPFTTEGDVKQLVMIHSYQVDPVSNELIHVDFHAVKADEKTQATVPVVLEGESDVEANKEWKIELVKDSVLVEALPADIPHEIKVDVSIIKTTKDTIFIKSLDLWNKITIKDNCELPLVTVVAIQSEVEETEESTEENKEE